MQSNSVENTDNFDEKSLDLGVYETLVDLFDNSCNQYADLPAFSNLGQTLTYRELRRSVDDFTAFLQNRTDLVPGDRIAVQLPNLLQYPIVLFSALRAGLVVVNTNPLYTAEEMEFQFKDSGAKALVVLANMAHLVEKIIDRTDIKTVLVTEVGDALGPVRRPLINGIIKYVKRMVPDYRLPNAISFVAAMKEGGSA